MDTGRNDLSPVLISAKSEEASGIFSFELRHPAGEELPPFEPGAHIAVEAPNGLVRKYSLCNSASERHRYIITIKKEENGRGGSISLAGGAAPGSILHISKPRNDFPLVPSRNGYIFVAGGIGITPILSMIRHIKDTGGRFNLYYCTRSPELTAFAAELTAPELRGQVKIHHDNGDPHHAVDLWPVLEKPKGQHVYCCGPRSLMDSVRDMAGHWPASAIHFESFTDAAPVHPADTTFFVRIAGSDQIIKVPPGTSILEALRHQGFKLLSSCESGSCGTCRTTFIAGEPDHRDFVLAEAERTNTIMICVSRAKSHELVIAL